MTTVTFAGSAMPSSRPFAIRKGADAQTHCAQPHCPARGVAPLDANGVKVRKESLPRRSVAISGADAAEELRSERERSLCEQLVLEAGRQPSTAPAV